jgi:hypothetical protein
MTKLEKGVGLSRRLIGGWMLIAGCWTGAYAGGYAEDWGPPLGARLPMLAAQDQDGQPRRLEDLVGRHGLLLFLHRSADW